MPRLVLLSALALSAAPLAAQSTVQPAPALPPTTPLPADPGYDRQTPRTDAVNAAEAPVTAALNNEVQDVTAVRDVVRSAEQQAQYDSDIAAYRAQVVANHAAVASDEARYARQQRAYADAMFAWRIQAEDCRKGRRKACEAPTPNPAAFY